MRDPGLSSVPTDGPSGGQGTATTHRLHYTMTPTSPSAASPAPSAPPAPPAPAPTPAGVPTPPTPPTPLTPYELLTPLRPLGGIDSFVADVPLRPAPHDGATQPLPELRNEQLRTRLAAATTAVAPAVTGRVERVVGLRFDVAGLDLPLGAGV